LFTLIDYDNASNVHGWQWSASTGTDAVPYFRMFNPIRQSEKFDSNGYFIKSEIELFKEVPTHFIHNPTLYRSELYEKYNIEFDKDYPNSIVNHNESRKYVLEKFKSINKY
ncbi:FAD-binding domain-containing protein, partial [Mammaliicoccus sciuri]|uniref:FAD-binding domain-containing protein n=1 Tax=Mammaliicoccus sciuri TaxID=1296 RepID=UPI001EF3F8D0